ncbi:MAG: sensor histidine kinase [Flavobacterium sp.]
MEKWQDPKIIALWIAIIIVLVATIMGFVGRILYAGYKRMAEAALREANLKLEHQKMLLQTSLETQEKERNRIAADLHDGLIGKLTVVRLKSQIGAEAAELDTLMGESIAEARRISHDLTPPMLNFSTLAEITGNIVLPWKDTVELSYDTDVRTAIDATPEVKIQLVRIVQEIITNIMKHAEATTVNVRFRHTGSGFALKIGDNGKGFDTAILKQGLGLNSLELRVQYLGGRYKIKSVPGKGTTVILISPLNIQTHGKD